MVMAAFFQVPRCCRGLNNYQQKSPSLNSAKVTVSHASKMPENGMGNYSALDITLDYLLSSIWL